MTIELAFCVLSDFYNYFKDIKIKLKVRAMVLLILFSGCTKLDTFTSEVHLNKACR